MATDALTSRKMDAARSVLRQVGLGLPAPGPLLSPLGMASLSADSADSAFPVSRAQSAADGVADEAMVGKMTGRQARLATVPTLTQTAPPANAVFTFPPTTLGLGSAGVAFTALPRFLSPTMPDDLTQQIAACKSRIANVRAVIGMMRAMGEPIAEAEQQLMLELAFLRTLEDIRSEKESAAQGEEETAESDARRKLQ